MKKQLCRQLVIGLGIASLALVTTACRRDQGATQEQQTGDETATGTPGTDERMQAPGEEPRMGAADQPEGTVQEPGEPGAPPAGEYAQLDQQTVEGLRELHVFHTVQIELAEVAQDKQLSDRAKEFVSKLAEDHRNADEQLMTMTRDFGIQLEEEPELPAAMRSRIESLKQADDQRFEQLFVRQESEMLQQNLDKLRQLRQQATNEQIRSHLEQVIQVVEQHQEQTKALQGQAS